MSYEHDHRDMQDAAYNPINDVERTETPIINTTEASFKTMESAIPNSTISGVDVSPEPENSNVSFVIPDLEMPNAAGGIFSVGSMEDWSWLDSFIADLKNIPNCEIDPPINVIDEMISISLQPPAPFVENTNGKINSTKPDATPQTRCPQPPTNDVIIDCGNSKTSSGLNIRWQLRERPVIGCKDLRTIVYWTPEQEASSEQTSSSTPEQEASSIITSFPFPRHEVFGHINMSTTDLKFKELYPSEIHVNGTKLATIRPKQKYEHFGIIQQNKIFDRTPVTKSEPPEMELNRKASKKGLKPKIPEPVVKNKAPEKVMKMKAPKISSAAVVYNCSVCKLIFPKKDALRRHSEVHVGLPGQLQLHVCEVCQVPFKHKVTYVKHMTTHGKSEGGYCCKICSRIFQSHRSLRRHLMNHYRPNVEDTVQEPTNP